MRKRIPLAYDKKLVLIRHAHRDTEGGAWKDNGISLKGRKQVHRLKKILMKRFPKTELTKLKKEPNQVLFLTSPKIRCQKTLAPLAKYAGVKSEIHPLLGEGPQLEGRAEEFIKEWKRMGAQLTVICSHGDLLPVMLEKLCGEEKMIPKGGYAEVSFLIWDGP